MACELDPRVDLTFVRLQKNFVTYKDITSYSSPATERAPGGGLPTDASDAGSSVAGSFAGGPERSAESEVDLWF